MSIKTDIPEKASTSLTEDLEQMQKENVELKAKVEAIEKSKEGLTMLLQRILELEKQVATQKTDNSKRSDQ